MLTSNNPPKNILGSPDYFLRETYKRSQRHDVFSYSLEIPSGLDKLVISSSLSPRKKEQNSDEIIEKTVKSYISRLPTAEIRKEAKKYFKEEKPRLYEKLEINNATVLALFDGERTFRGRYETRFLDRYVIVGSSTSSPGFISRPIKGGEWEIEVATHTIVSDSVTLELGVWCLEEDFDLDDELETEIPGFKEELPPVVKKNSHSPYDAKDGEKKWFPGELHTHSHHSDGKFSISQLQELMVQRGLSYFALTDHNTVSGFEEMGHHPELTIIPGMEVTAFGGHLVALGIGEYLDWPIIEEESGVEKLLQRIHKNGGIASIAHPYSLPNPLCGGCHWEFSKVPYGQLEMFEVWNGTYKNNRYEMESAIHRYEELLAQGHRIVAVSGLDFHSLDDLKLEAPVTYIKAEEPTVGNLLTALAEGSAIISTGPKIRLNLLRANGKIAAGVGQEATFARVEEGAILFEIQNLGSSELEARLFKGGRVWSKERLTREGRFTFPYSHKEDTFIHLKIRDPETNELKVFTNPIYITSRK
ncbi:CehA/McbA family metallohydrolase [Candidatus Bipolaricaulota bacterium]|nr:CehA/McbA family metallohydrolase [Candidatus Bipolaricaulota bacterium]